ncbi:MAG: DUF4007 family protein [Clostridium saudiense]|uniref:DUF4007 family protein n=1 Tax=uncultured Clostridium sp. TaxID=59620 RepID=UPI0008229A22|nr:DUF4007 family protein [uncultured Clostridium sp.]MEE0727750.1 DUF4007 family protein [Clostridium saudiense]SCJ87494.1 Uncharacterised protein [uncultured Clostridium sp.]
MSNTKIKIRGHESFYIREGWLRKGIVSIVEQPDILSNTQVAIDKLGVGSAMVKSIRYWLQAIQLTEEKRGDKGKRYQELTEDFGKIVFENDPYFEDLGSLYLLHYKLVTNKELATTWNLFFNGIKATEMTKYHMEEALEQLILNIDPEHNISSRSLSDDCNCIIKTYFAEKSDIKNPEDNMICPFTDLGLLNKVNIKGKEEVIFKIIPNRNKLDRLIILYVILDNIGDNSSTTIKSLIEDENNIGRVFNLDKNSVNYYVDLLEDEGYLSVNRTAGLNTIYPTDLAVDILNKYYSEF